LAKPTVFHQFLRALDNRLTLLRVYTQNVDGLELKAGLHTAIPHNFSKTQNPPVRCIPLHGTLDELQCSSCISIFKLEPYYPSLINGQFPECSQCCQNADERAQRGARKLQVPRMRSNIILYGEEHPHGDIISKVQKSDISEIDFLLVVGTSLTVDGTTKMIRHFSKALQTKFPTKNLESPRIIYLNYNYRSPSAWNCVFDGWVEADCEDFAKMGLDILKKEWLDKQYDDSEAEGFLFTDRRLDSRPSWRL
jgi:NAD-dependent SIR2 family protein deacetylase